LIAAAHSEAEPRADAMGTSFADVSRMKRMVERARLRPSIRIARAIIVCGALVGSIGWLAASPKWMMCCMGGSKTHVARMAVHKYADEAYVQWRMDHSGLCPERLRDLNEYTNSKDTKDPWGNPYRIQCDATHPIFVSSAGEDGLFGTGDDVRSSD
jgi:hypothetical protein